MTVIEKTLVYRDGREFLQVTFSLPGSTWAGTINLVGDFNGWNRTSHPLRQNERGFWSITVELEAGRAFEFRYLRDGTGWMNDSQADAYTTNEHGTQNFIVLTTREALRRLAEPSTPASVAEADDTPVPSRTVVPPKRAW